MYRAPNSGGKRLPNLLALSEDYAPFQTSSHLGARQWEKNQYLAGLNHGRSSHWVEIGSGSTQRMDGHSKFKHSLGHLNMGER
jgi:hypothetical protein